MSRAFVSEAAAEKSAGLIPERPISTGRNLVTPGGLDLIEAHASRLQALLGGTGPEDPARPAIARDLRYWIARRQTAEVVPHAAVFEEVAFGATVTISRNGTASTYRIVGEDEADPAKGLLSWTSPLAGSLLGARAGEAVEVGGGRPAVTVVAIRSGDVISPDGSGA